MGSLKRLRRDTFWWLVFVVVGSGLTLSSCLEVSRSGLHVWFAFLMFSLSVYVVGIEDCVSFKQQQDFVNMGNGL